MLYRPVRIHCHSVKWTGEHIICVDFIESSQEADIDIRSIALDIYSQLAPR